MKQLKITEDFVGTRLDRFLRKQNLNLKQGDIEVALRKSQIRINSKKQKSSYRLQLSDIVEIDEKLELPENLPLKKQVSFNADIIKKIENSIIYKDKDILVINKPQGLAVQGGSKILHSLDNYLSHMLRDDLPKLVHRLDKDTSGVMIVALNNKSAAELSRLLKERQVKKTYLCVVIGEVIKKQGTIKLHLTQDFNVKSSLDEGKESVTNYKLLDKTKIASLLEMSPITGRKHQIRVSCLELGHPILGDGKYGGRAAFIKSFSNVLHLHAKTIEIDDFFGKKLQFSAPLPAHMLETCEFLRFNGN